MRVLKISAAIASSICLLYFSNVEASVGREVIKTRAVSVAYTSSASAYSYAHRACQKYWRKDIANIISERPSFAVEIVTVSKEPKRVSALCVSRKYINDEVVRVVQR